MIEERSVNVIYSDEFADILQLIKKIRHVYVATQNSRTNSAVMTFIQPYFEMRYTLEHIADALSGENENPKAEIEEARSHLLRCYTDLTEWRFLQIKVYAARLTKRTPTDVIEQAMQGYYVSVFPLFDQVEKALSDVKETHEKKVRGRIDLLDAVNEKCETILGKLNEHALSELKRKSRSAKVGRAIKWVLTALGGAFIGALVDHFIK